MIYTALTEVFFTYVKVSFFAACFVSAPVFLGQFWAFVAPGLYKNERSAFMPFLFATPVLFLMGGALVYYLIMPLAWKFFLSFEQAGGAANLAIQLEAKVGEYLSLGATSQIRDCDCVWLCGGSDTAGPDFTDWSGDPDHHSLRDFDRHGAGF